MEQLDLLKYEFNDGPHTQVCQGPGLIYLCYPESARK